MLAQGFVVAGRDQAVLRRQRRPALPKAREPHRVDALAPGIELFERGLGGVIGELFGIELACHPFAQFHQDRFEAIEHRFGQGAPHQGSEQAILDVLVA